MNSDRESSTAATLFRSLLELWLPAAKALELKQDLGACSLEESQGAAERAGCEVSYVDLPAKVSGFAQVDCGQASYCPQSGKASERLEIHAAA